MYLTQDFQWLLNDLTSRIVALSGIPTDRFHLGKIMLQSFKDDPNFVMQIDGATGEQDTFRAALSRSVHCSTALKNLGLKRNDVIVVMGNNCLDLPITLYAGLYLGVGVAGFDMTLGINENMSIFKQCTPSVVFSQSATSALNAKKALEALDINVPIVTYDETSDFMSFREFLDKYGDTKPFEEFKPNDFDPSETYALILPTSGTTGTPKLAPMTHSNIIIGFPSVIDMMIKYPTPIKLALCTSPVQWLSANLYYILSPVARFSRVQSSLSTTIDHVNELINKYKPTFTIFSPTFLTSMIKTSNLEKCDFSCFENIVVGGSAVTSELLNNVAKVLPNVTIYPTYGMTEACSMMFSVKGTVAKHCGVPKGHLKYRLVDPSTGKDILETNKTGELWVKGPSVIKAYYNNVEATEEIFSDGWLKTGDIFYRDDDYHFYFVDRLKLLLKYKNHQVSPNEIENVILKHPGVHDVAVTGITDEDGDLPVACVIPKEGHKITIQEIKDLVKAELAETKQLRGGVVFLREFPVTSTSKINRKALRALVNTMERP